MSLWIRAQFEVIRNKIFITYNQSYIWKKAEGPEQKCFLVNSYVKQGDRAWTLWITRWIQWSVYSYVHFWGKCCVATTAIYLYREAMWSICFSSSKPGIGGTSVRPSAEVYEWSISGSGEQAVHSSDSDVSVRQVWATLSQGKSTWHWRVWKESVVFFISEKRKLLKCLATFPWTFRLFNA